MRLMRAILGLRHLVPLVNAIADGTHERAITKKCDAALAAADLLVMPGTDADHVAVATGVTSVPFGPCNAPTDEAEESVGVMLLGKGPTKMGVASGAIAQNDRLTPAAGGKVATYTAGAATWIGRALTAAADGEPVEYADCVPTPISA